MTDLGEAERATLDAGIEKLRPVLKSRGFEYPSGTKAVSSGGTFAVGCFRRGALEIGLIVRHGVALGCPNYSLGRGYAGHQDSIWALGAEGKQQLVAGDWLSVKSRGGDSFEALRHDFELIMLPSLDVSETQFLAALERAVDKGRAKIGLPPQSSG